MKIDMIDGSTVVVVQRVLAPYNIPLYRSLAARRHRVLVVHGQPQVGEPFPPTSESMFPARTAEVRNRHFGRPWRACWQQGVVRTVLQAAPSAIVVEGNVRLLSNFILLVRARLAGIPVLWWALGARPTPLSRLAVALSSAAIAYSTEGAAELKNIGARQTTVAFNATVDPITVDDLEFDLSHQRLRERPQLTFVGKLVPEKAVDRLLDALTTLQVDCDLVIAGDGPCRAELERQVMRLGLGDRVRFAGATDPAQTGALMRSSNLFVLPGTGGLAIQEAISMGLPCVVGRADGTQHDLIAEGGGWLLPSDTTADLSETLALALGSDLASASRAALATAGHRSLSAMVDSFDAAISNAEVPVANVVWVTPNFRPARNMGGSQEIVADLAQTQAGCTSVAVITTDYPGLHESGRLEQRCVEDGPVNVIRLRNPPGRSPQRGLFLLQVTDRRRLLRTADVVLLSELRSGIHVMVAFWCRRYRTPYGIVPWGSAGAHQQQPLRHRVWDLTAGRLVYGGATRAFAQTELELTDVERIFPGRGVVVPLGTVIDDDERTFEPKSFADGPLRVLTVARLNKLKHLDVLIEALHGIDDVQLTIVGSDEGAEPMLRSLVARLGLQARVNFLGPVYGSRVRDLYRAHEVFLLAPKFNEGTSLASLAAAVNGCAPMVSEQVGITGLKSGDNGWMIEPDPIAVRAGLVKALAAKRDDRLIGIRRAGQALGLAHDIRLVADRYLSEVRRTQQ